MRRFLKSKKLLISILLLIAAISFSWAFYASRGDTQCTGRHTTSIKPPKTLLSVQDFFAQGNYDYTIGMCQQAVSDYSKAIALDHNLPELYNNRAYTYMRLQEYPQALSDLDTALMLRPHYIEALMNRGDIYNYYFAINKQKALADYTTVLNLTAPSERQMLSLCGHRLLAQTNGWSVQTIWQLLTHGMDAGCQ